MPSNKTRYDGYDRYAQNHKPAKLLPKRVFYKVVLILTDFL